MVIAKEKYIGHAIFIVCDAHILLLVASDFFESFFRYPNSVFVNLTEPFVYPDGKLRGIGADLFVHKIGVYHIYSKYFLSQPNWYLRRLEGVF